MIDDDCLFTLTNFPRDNKEKFDFSEYIFLPSRFICGMLFNDFAMYSYFWILTIAIFIKKNSIDNIQKKNSLECSKFPHRIHEFSPIFFLTVYSSIEMYLELFPPVDKGIKLFSSYQVAFSSFLSYTPIYKNLAAMEEEKHLNDSQLE